MCSFNTSWNKKNPHRYSFIVKHHQFVMFDVSEVASSTLTSLHDVLHSSSTSLTERPWTHRFSLKWVYRHKISSKVFPPDAGLFPAALGEETFILASSMMDFSIYHYGASVKLADLQRKPCSLIMSDIETLCFRSLGHFLLSNHCDAALEMSWHYVTLCKLD